MIKQELVQEPALTELPEMQRTRFGEFTHRQSYRGICDPVLELNSGVGVVSFRAIDTFGNTLTFMVGQKPDADDTYSIVGHTESMSDPRIVLSLDMHVPESETSGLSVRVGDLLGDVIHEDFLTDTDKHAVIDGVVGYSSPVDPTQA